MGLYARRSVGTGIGRVSSCLDKAVMIIIPWMAMDAPRNVLPRYRDSTNVEMV